MIIYLWISNEFQLCAVSGNSMEPSLHDSQMVIMNTWDKKVSRGDIIVAKINYEDSKVVIIKRVIGVAGDCVEIKHNHLFVNNELIEESYVKDKDWEKEENIWFVPDNRCFLLGDNRDDSLDSRYNEVGFVSYKDILGKVLQ